VRPPEAPNGNPLRRATLDDFISDILRRETDEEVTIVLILRVARKEP